MLVSPCETQIADRTLLNRSQVAGGAFVVGMLDCLLPCMGGPSLVGELVVGGRHLHPDKPLSWIITINREIFVLNNFCMINFGRPKWVLNYFNMQIF